MGSGWCICKPQFAGENCDRCADGHYYYPDCFRKFSFALTCQVRLFHAFCTNVLNAWFWCCMFKNHNTQICLQLLQTTQKVQLVFPVPHLNLDLKGRLCFVIEGCNYSWSVNLNPVVNSWNHDSTLFYSQISPWTNTFVQSLFTKVHLAGVHL